MHNVFYRVHDRNNEWCLWCMLTQRENRKKIYKMVLKLFHVQFDCQVLHTLGWHHTSVIETFYLFFLHCMTNRLPLYWQVGGIPSLHETPEGFCGPQTQWWAEKESFFWPLKHTTTVRAQLFDLLLPTVNAPSPAEQLADPAYAAAPWCSHLAGCLLLVTAVWQEHSC